MIGYKTKLLAVNKLHINGCCKYHAISFHFDNIIVFEHPDIRVQELIKFLSCIAHDSFRGCKVLVEPLNAVEENILSQLRLCRNDR